MIQARGLLPKGNGLKKLFCSSELILEPAALALLHAARELPLLRPRTLLALAPLTLREDRVDRGVHSIPRVPLLASSTAQNAEQHPVSLRSRQVVRVGGWRGYLVQVPVSAQRCLDARACSSSSCSFSWSSLSTSARPTRRFFAVASAGGVFIAPAPRGQASPRVPFPPSDFRMPFFPAESRGGWACGGGAGGGVGGGGGGMRGGGGGGGAFGGGCTRQSGPR